MPNLHTPRMQPAVVDVVADHVSSMLTVTWPGIEVQARTLSEEQLASIEESLHELERAERYAPGRIVATRRALGETLRRVLEGPDQHLTKALSDSEIEGRPLDLVVRLKMKAPSVSLDRHPAVAWRWELIATLNGHPAAQGSLRLSVQLGNVDPRRTAPVRRYGLRILFMALAPRDQEEVLDYEIEEEKILECLAQPMTQGRARLHVVEDGTLNELQQRLRDFEPNVLHISGRGRLTPAGPRLLFETSQGETDEVSPEALLRVLTRAHRPPDLVVIASCFSAHASNDLPSFTAALVAGGIPAVIGWTQKVGDHIATEAATTLYEALCRGDTPHAAVAYARKQLFEADRNPRHQSHAWGTLQLVSSNAVGFRIDDEMTVDLPPLPRSSRALYRLLQVPEHEFVGRRRPLQQLVEILSQGKNHGRFVAGATIVGNRGVGKSSLAARSLARLEDKCGSIGVVVLRGRLDDTRVLQQFVDQAMRWCDPQAEEILSGPGPVLVRVQRLLRGHWATHPLIILIDDFEDGNLVLRGDGPARMTPYAAEFFEALLSICRDHDPKLLLTTTASFALPPGHEHSLAEIPLGSFETPSIRKLWARLPQMWKSMIPPRDWAELAATLGANALLLDWVRDIMCGQVPEILVDLARRAGVPPLRRNTCEALEPEQVEALRHAFIVYQGIPDARRAVRGDMLTFLERARVYRSAVPRRALEGLTDGLGLDLDRDLVVLLNHGLLEVSETQGQRSYRVSPLIVPRFEAPLASRWHAVAAKFYESIARDFNGYRRAWEHALLAEDEAAASRCCEPLRQTLRTAGRIMLDRDFAHRHLERFPASSTALLWAGSAEYEAGNVSRGWELYAQGEQVARAQGIEGAQWHEIERYGADMLTALAQFDIAAARLRRLIEVGSDTGDVELLMHSLNSLGVVLKAQASREHIDAAHDVLTHALEIELAHHDDEYRLDIAQTRHSLGCVLLAQGDALGAREQLERSLHIKEQILSSETFSEIATTLRHLAMVQSTLGESALAVAACERALRIEEQVFGTRDQIHSAVTEFRLGMLLLWVGDANRAENLLTRTYRVLNDKVPNHPFRSLIARSFGVPASRHHLTRLVIRDRLAGGTIERDLSDGLVAFASLDPALEPVVAHLERIALGEPLPSIDESLPPPVPRYLARVHEMVESAEQNPLDS